MPIYQIIETISEGKMFIWKIDETIDYLKQNVCLSEIEKEKFKSIKSQKQQLCFLAVRTIFKKANIEEKVFYKNGKKPTLEDGFISVSHSYPWAFVGVCKKKIGVDVEKIRENICSLSVKFTDYKTQDRTFLTKIWTVKESLFKSGGVGGVDFKKHLIYPYNTDDCALICHPLCKETYKVESFKIDDYIFSVLIKND